jgi:hypothetical protein
MANNFETKSVNIPIDWNINESVIPRFSTDMFISHTENIFSLMFFEVSQPLLLGSEEEILSQIKSLKSIKADCVSKIYVAPATIPRLISALQENYDKYLSRFSKNIEDGE